MTEWELWPHEPVRMQMLDLGLAERGRSGAKTEGLSGLASGRLGANPFAATAS